MANKTESNSVDFCSNKQKCDLCHAINQKTIFKKKSLKKTLSLKRIVQTSLIFRLRRLLRGSFGYDLLNVKILYFLSEALRSEPRRNGP